MNPYFFTLAFIFMMSLLTSSQVIRYAQGTLLDRIDSQAFSNQTEAEKLIALTHLDTFKKQINDTTPTKKEDNDVSKKQIYKKSNTSEKKARALGISATRPPNNSRLNLYTLIHGNNKKKWPDNLSLYEICARLIKSLYHNEPSFQAIPEAEYKILDAIREKKEETSNFTEPDELATLIFDNEELQHLFYQMLKGNKESPSLLHYITFEKIESQEQRRKINFLFADPLIIKAIFPIGNVAEKLIEARESIWDRIIYQEENRSNILENESSNRSDFSAEIKNVLNEVLSNEGYRVDKYESCVFDCTLGKHGNVIFMEDETTGRLIRQKYSSLKKK